MLGFTRHWLAPAAGALAATFLGVCAHASPGGDERFAAFAKEMAQRHGLERAEVQRVLGASERRQDIIDAISSPAEALPWRRYRPIFLKESRIEQGVEFWMEHEALLNRASKEYGVPPELIVAIIGVETRYGGYTGKHRVIDALRTLAFDYPRRSGFFRGELEEFFLLAREEGFDPLGPVGSYAGAMGLPQFIASSYRAYAVDFNDDGYRDLWDQPADAIGSVANYFARHGWRPGEPVVRPAKVTGDTWRRHVSKGLKPNTTVGELGERGVKTQSRLPAESAATLIVLEGENGNEFWIGLENFYVITRYNHSALYAMAVHQLSRAIAERRGARG